MSRLRQDARFVRGNKPVRRVAAVSAAQAEARVHNYTKMVVCAARANLCIQRSQDKRLNPEVYGKFDQIIILLNDLIEGWK
jgi:hypothetical protein